jgi:Tfp pilus assembly protein PilX
MGNSFLLILGSLLLLTLFSLASNRLIGENERIAEESEFNLTAFSLAQSIIDEAKSKEFDQHTVGAELTTPVTLTAAAQLGPDPGEELSGADSTSDAGYASMTRFNDVDDYNGYHRYVSTPRADGYEISVQVAYASTSCPDSLLSTPTFCKHMVVSVSSRYFSNPVTVQFAFMY